MKINRFIALAAIALLVIGAMGMLTYRTFAQSDQPTASSDCNGEDDDAAEAQEVEDTDDVEDQCGDQFDGADESEGAYESEGADEADEVAPAGTPVTAEEAQAIAEAANPGTTTLNVEFDRENGTVIWEVELDNGQDVKVDASSGVILLSEGRD